VAQFEPIGVGDSGGDADWDVIRSVSVSETAPAEDEYLVGGVGKEVCFERVSPIYSFLTFPGTRVNDESPPSRLRSWFPHGSL
jgi:hypothetical protein